MNQFHLIFGTPWPWWLIVLSGIGAGALTLRGYRNRSNEVPSAKLNILKALRMTGWSLLFICLLQPIYRQLIKEPKASRLTVLVDDSESMGFIDARGGSTRIERVKAALMGAAIKPKDGGATQPGKESLLAVCANSFKVQLESFASSSRPIVHPDDLQAKGPSSDISKALTESFSRLKGPDAGGLVLISDGADTARGEITRVVNAYKRAGTPIYVLGVGNPDVQDLAIAQVRSRRTVSKDTLVKVEVDVRAVGIPDGKHNISISRNSRAVESRVVEVKDGAGTAIFEFLPDSQGFLIYEAEIERFPGELVVENNKMTFGLMAYSRKLRILYMEGSMYVHEEYFRDRWSPHRQNNPFLNWWEHQFMENALTEDSDVEVDVLAKEEFKIPVNATPLNLKTVKEGYPKTKKDLYQYDVIVSSDIPKRAFSDEQIQWTVDFVGKHGGGFIMIGGYDAFAEGKYARSPIDKMLPVEMFDEEHVERRNLTFKLTDEAWSHPIMQIEKDAEKNREAWARLPAFHGFSKTTRPKPAATTLAVIADESYETAYGPAITIAVQPFGNGRSMAFTSDSTGSWGAEWEDFWGPKDATDLANRNLYYKTFWKNAIRWLAHYRMQAPNQLVTIESDRLVYGRGEEPELRVKVMNEDYELTHDAKVSLSVKGIEGKARSKSQTVTVFPRYEEAGIYERKLELTETGVYEVEAIAMLGKEEVGRDKTILHVQAATVETRQLSQNVALLKRLADESGGKYLPLEKAAELPEFLRAATHVIEKHKDHDMWDKPWIFAVIIGLLCSEWFLRKRSGLP